MKHLKAQNLSQRQMLKKAIRFFSFFIYRRMNFINLKLLFLYLLLKYIIYFIVLISLLQEIYVKNYPF